ncbi:MAG: hypothetical protein WDO69_05635 [Pseudomonadota bacterium]
MSACDSGHVLASGQRCPGEAAVMIEVMPRHLRESHTEAGNSGRYPHNGALRLLVCEACAEILEESEGDWFERVGAS